MGTSGVPTDSGLLEVVSLLGDESLYAKRLKELMSRADEAQRMLVQAKENNRAAEDAKAAAAEMLNQAQTCLAEANEMKEKAECSLADVVSREDAAKQREYGFMEERKNIEELRENARKEVWEASTEIERLRLDLKNDAELQARSLANETARVEAHHKAILESARKEKEDAAEKTRQAEEYFNQAHKVKEDYSSRLAKLVAVAHGE